MSDPAAPENKFELSAHDYYNKFHHADVRRLTTTHSASRLLLLGIGTKDVRYNFSWPTNADAEIVIRSIHTGAIAIRAVRYGYSQCFDQGKLIVAPEDPTKPGWRTAYLHDLVDSDRDFVELDARNADDRSGIEWVKAFDLEDFQADQFCITSAGAVALTDIWVQELIASTAAEPWLSQNAEALTAQLQAAFEGEKILAALGGIF